MALSIICDANAPDQNGRLLSFDGTGAALEQDFVRGDINLALSIRPVVSSATGTRPWDDDFLAGDTFQVAIGNTDLPPTGGTFDLAVDTGVTVTAAIVANPTSLTTSGAHGLSTGNTIYLAGLAGTTPEIGNQVYVATVLDGTHFTIPVNVTDVPGSFPALGLFKVTGLSGLPYNISASALATALTISPLTAPTVTLLTTGVYEARWGVGLAAPTLLSPQNSLAPACQVSVLDDSTVEVQIRIIDLKQAPVAYAEPATAFPAASVTATIKQAGSSTANKIYAITFGAPGTYAGTYAIQYTAVDSAHSTVGAFTPGQDPNDILAALEAISAVGDFAVSQDASGLLTIVLQGTQGLSNAPIISVANINLMAPLGVSGVIALNTDNLYRAFWNTTEQTLDFLLEIRRTRATGEAGAIFQHPVTLKRNLIDGVIVPIEVASYYTKAQVDGLLASKQPLDSTLTNLSARGVTGTGTIVLSVAPTVTGLVTDTLNGNTFTTGTYTLTGAAGKTLTFSQNITLTTDGTGTRTLNIGAGGTLGAGAFAAAANPTGSVGLSAVNGSAATFMRSDGAPALNVSIVPTWTGAHTFSAVLTISNSTAATSTTTGCAVLAGGLGVAGRIYVGGNLLANSGTASTSTITGAVVITGGLGVSTTIWCQNLNIVSDVGISGGNLTFGAVGKGISLKAGTGQRAGDAVLVGGTVTVTNSSVTANTRILVTTKTPGGTLGTGGYAYTLSAGASFTINSIDTAGVLSILNTSTVSYLLVEVA